MPVTMSACACVCARPSDLGPQPLSPESTTSILQSLASPANISGHTHTLRNTQPYTHAFRDMIQGQHFEEDAFVILLVILCSTEITQIGKQWWINVGNIPHYKDQYNMIQQNNWQLPIKILYNRRSRGRITLQGTSQKSLEVPKLLLKVK